MKSSSGQHFIALDHVRALAAFLVVTWHFTHGRNGYPVPFEGAPTVFPLALLDEGHTGVALFMALSGYLFAKLLKGRSICFAAFYWNRALRLLPLLLVVIVVVGILNLIAGQDFLAYASRIARGALLPTLPNGGWSITAELHFYALLPLLLWLFRQSKLLPLLIVLAAIILRVTLHEQNGQVQSAAYWTIAGRIDQFVLGMFMFNWRERIARRHALAVAVALGLSLFYWYFAELGGFYLNLSYPSPSRLWIIIPTIEGCTYAFLIAWYDTSFTHSRGRVSRFISRMGEYSYSTYLLHFFFVFPAARAVHENIMDISNFYLACVWAAAFFLWMMLLGYLSFRFIEAPFLTLRRHYTQAPANSS